MATEEEIDQRITKKVIISRTFSRATAKKERALLVIGSISWDKR
jgi:hypothetical protein